MRTSQNVPTKLVLSVWPECTENRDILFVDQHQTVYYEHIHTYSSDSETILNIICTFTFDFVSGVSWSRMSSGQMCGCWCFNNERESCSLWSLLLLNFIKTISSSNTLFLFSTVWTFLWDFYFTLYSFPPDFVFYGAALTCRNTAVMLQFLLSIIQNTDSNELLGTIQRPHKPRDQVRLWPSNREAVLLSRAPVLWRWSPAGNQDGIYHGWLEQGLLLHMGGAKVKSLPSDRKFLELSDRRTLHITYRYCKMSQIRFPAQPAGAVGRVQGMYLVTNHLGLGT